MHGERTFRIDAFADSAFRYLNRDAIVCVDVIMSSTTVVSGVAQGRRIVPLADTEAALSTAQKLPEALLAGEVDGAVPPGFQFSNSPFQIALGDPRIPVLLAAPGTALMVNAGGARAAYVACFRNLSVTAAHLARNHERVAVVGAGFDGEFRTEDQMAAAMIGRVLMAHGFESEDIGTSDLVSRWSGADPSLARFGRSAAELLRAGRAKDLEFVLSHFDDLQVVCRLIGGEARGLDCSRQIEDAVLRPRAVGEWWGEEWGIVVPFAPGSTVPPEGQ
jgi:phosphosulfolactate phosphohydrolase-like enzyme